MLTQAEIINQEQQALLKHFNLADVDLLVTSLRKLGPVEFDKVCILITINKREVYFHAGTQTTNENNLWIRKKANVGGGFPIGIQETGIIGTLIVSGLSDEEDHDLAYHALLDLQSQQI